MDAIKTFKSKDGKQLLKIYQDENPESPREWDNLGNIICWYRQYILGDKHNFKTPDDFREHIKLNKSLVLPLYLYDHSGITISTSSEYPYNDRWDAGQVGFIYVTHEQLKKEYSVKRITPAILAKAKKILEDEVKTYDQFLIGDVYGFMVVEPVKCDCCDHVEEKLIDSCWGFYGDNLKESGIYTYAGNDWVEVEK